LKIKLATSVSTTSFAVAAGGEVNLALLINEAYKLFGFLRRSSEREPDRFRLGGSSTG
jgi:hypothetical protein